MKFSMTTAAAMIVLFVFTRRQAWPRAAVFHETAMDVAKKRKERASSFVFVLLFSTIAGLAWLLIRKKLHQARQLPVELLHLLGCPMRWRQTMIRGMLRVDGRNGPAPKASATACCLLLKC